MATTNESWIHYQAALKVARILNGRKFEAYLIGGAVRDLLLGRIPKDFDLVTNAEPEQILELPELKQAIRLDPAQAFGVTKVKVPLEIRGAHFEGEVEVASYRRDIEAHLGRKATKIEFAHLEDDVVRRDYTVNALALDLANDYLVDEVGGLEDLDKRLLRFIGAPSVRIQEDPLRIIRGIRLKNQLDFIYDFDTSEAIKAAVAAGHVESIAVERLAEELTRMLVNPHRARALEDLAEFGILKRILPEVAITKGVLQPPQFHSEGDVWAHTLLALQQLDDNPSPRLAWATLLHDIGKPPTFASAEETGDRIRFSQHYSVGADLATKLLTRLRFSKRLTADISWMIDHHMGIDDLPKMRPGRQNQVLAHPAFADLFALHKADAQASWRLLPGAMIDKSAPDFPAIEQLWTDWRQNQHKPQPSLKQDLGIDGAWLMREFKLGNGPELGAVLAKLNEAYLDGEIKDATAAKTLVQQLLSRQRSG